MHTFYKVDLKRQNVKKYYIPINYLNKIAPKNYKPSLSPKLHHVILWVYNI